MSNIEHYRKQAVHFSVTVLLFLLWNSITVVGQSDSLELESRASIYFYWGYNRSYFSQSNIHFSGPNYDFTLYNVMATDAPTRFGLSYFNPVTATIPQYNARLGYIFKSGFGVSIGLDHMKYVVTHGQDVRLSGVISQAASEQYQGSYLNDTITITPDFLIFEHTDGFNHASIDFEYTRKIVRTRKDRFGLLWNFGVGGVWVITKTNVKVFGDGLDNHFHVSGFALSGKTGPRFMYKDTFFILAEMRFGYSSLPWIFIKNSQPERADQTLTFTEYYMAIGVNKRF